MKIPDLFNSKEGAPTSNEVTSPIINWVILVTTIFTAFAFWGWIASSLLEYARDRNISSSTVYFVLMIGAIGIMFLAYVLYWVFIRTSNVNIPAPKIKERK